MREFLVLSEIVRYIVLTLIFLSVGGLVVLLSYAITSNVVAGIEAGIVCGWLAARVLISMNRVITLTSWIGIARVSKHSAEAHNSPSSGV
jgi:hypothetical protein